MTVVSRVGPRPAGDTVGGKRSARLERDGAIAVGEQLGYVGRADPTAVDLLQVILGRPPCERDRSSDEHRTFAVCNFSGHTTYPPDAASSSARSLVPHSRYSTHFPSLK